jgi:hypothetical protein
LKRLLIVPFLLLILVFCVGQSGCEKSESADKTQSRQTEQMMSELNRQVGMPNVVNFQQKKLMKMIYELNDKEDLIAYAYLQSEYTGKLIYIGRCVGFGVPFSAQYTNPERIALKSVDYGSLTLPQPDPNGLFMPSASSATWLMMIDPETDEPRPVYFEPTIVVSPFQLIKGVSNIEDY